MIYTYLGGLAGFSFVILSMAEMASMYVYFRYTDDKIANPYFRFFSGPHCPVVSIIGCRSSHPQVLRLY